jgi:hypothetical protein
MAFNDFNYPTVLSDFGLALTEAALYPNIAPDALPGSFSGRFSAGAALGQAVNTEKARSEFIIAPVLLELRLTAKRPFGLFSGVELKADPKVGLTGVCDFLLTRQPLQTVVSAPLVAVVEAKNDNLRNGLGQCIAELVAAQMINRHEGGDGAVFGVVTTGTLWQFLRLDGNTVTLEPREYTLSDLGTVLAILRRIVEAD